MAECFVHGAGGGATLKVGSFTVSGNSKGQTVNLGGLPKFMLFSREKDALSFGGAYGSIMYAPAAAFSPVANDTVQIALLGDTSTYIQFSNTGFAVSINDVSSSVTYYYFAVM